MRNNFKKVFIVILIVLITNMILLINMKNVRAADSLVSSKDKIHFIKLDKTDSILIESNGHYGLIDTSNPSEDNTKEKNSKNHEEFNSSVSNGKTVVTYLNKIGVQSLDFVIGTHSHSDHIGGIPDICNGGNFVNSNTTYIYKQYTTIQDEEGGTYNWYNSDYFDLAISSMQGKTNRLLDVTNHSSTNLSSKLSQIDANAKFVDNSENVCDYIEFTFQNYNIKIFNLYLESLINENNNSLVVLITKGDNRMLFMGDMNVVNSTEQKIAKCVGDVDLIKIGHHGLFESTSLGLLKSTTPEIAVVTRDSQLTDTFAIAMTYFKEKGGSIYKTGDSNTAIVAAIGTNNIMLYTYDDSGNLTKTQSVISEEATRGWVYGYNDSEEIIWAYINEDGTFRRDWAKLSYNNEEMWFYFDTDGVMQTGWIKDEGLWYYLAPKGTDGYYMGEMVKGWKKINYEGKDYWFYFAQSATEINGLKEGAMATGWQKLRYNGTECLFYFKESKDTNYCTGAMVTDWQIIDGKAYYFNSDGVMEKEDVQAPNIVSITGNATDWTRSSVTLTINSYDDGIGLDDNAYSFDGGLTWQASNQETFNQNGQVDIKVKDKVGNVQSTTIDITKILKLESISVKSEPYKTSYYVGDTLDTNGLILTALYNSGLTEEIVSGFSCSPIELTKKGTKGIVVSYGGMQTSFTVQVSEVPENVEISLESSIYNIQNSKIAKIQPNTDAKEFKKNIITNSNEIKIYNTKNVEIENNDFIQTGMKLKLEDNSIYTLIVIGDVNGDAKSDLTDMNIINAYRLNEASLVAEYLLAGDVNSDGKVDVKDLMKINKYRLGKINSL